MGIVEETMEMESATKKTWVISGIQFMTPLKPIYTKKRIDKPHEVEEEEVEEEEKECCTTPTTPESRIPVLVCPGAPKKRKSVSRNRCNGVRNYFKPPELESVFLRCVERA
ncbi:putative cyclin-dependent protein kinase inhibitor SMR [Helianthus annuus]|nr:putative cyclin-dependent protein kinase inhibitor SMR [Helianthus annuus]